MPGTPFDARVRATGGTTVIELVGDIDRSATGGLDAAYEASGDAGPVVLDFTDVDYINSTGIALIVSLLAKARASGREVGAFGLSNHYREIFSLTRLSDFMSIYQDEREAVAGQAAKGGKHA